MARDAGLEALVREHLDEALGGASGLSEKPMFGGLAWMLDGRLLCGASDRGLMARLGKGQDAWALAHPQIEPLRAGRPLPGWIIAAEDAWCDDALRARLLEAALAFVRGLPAKRPDLA
ncbi:TfoX/Sxy family protein [Phenylobacterium sp.]|uniref:TfoX/Sxy family protein n=1 Tax=Phenylobacterium sp. TaxID=1871053 RepID=UPI00198E58E1|nr:TfoX/Sxy family protein [Phenylobacterium sp.]MBC7167560.1 TfoX/Sxy family protein [Phenylobacterium sp.]